MSYLRYFAYSGVQHILCCVIFFLYLRLVYDASFSGLSFFIASSVFSNVYAIYNTYI